MLKMYVQGAVVNLKETEIRRRARPKSGSSSFSSPSSFSSRFASQTRQSQMSAKRWAPVIALMCSMRGTRPTSYFYSSLGSSVSICFVASSASDYFVDSTILIYDF